MSNKEHSIYVDVNHIEAHIDCMIVDKVHVCFSCIVCKHGDIYVRMHIQQSVKLSNTLWCVKSGKIELYNSSLYLVLLTKDKSYALKLIHSSRYENNVEATLGQLIAILLADAVARASHYGPFPAVSFDEVLPWA